MILIHHMTAEQIDTLRDIFAKPVSDTGGYLAWSVPEWIKVAEAYIRVSDNAKAG